MKNWTKKQKEEARELINTFFSDQNSDLKKELYKSLLEQEYEEWEDWCCNMARDYCATNMIAQVIS